jgi:alpha-L-rhamnosidase
LLNYLTEHAPCSQAVFDHLNRTTQPGYGYFLERGESAWPEYWSVDVPSRIHTCYTGIASWFTKSLAGIRPDPDHPGFQSFLIQPVVAGDLTFAEGKTESLYGTIRSRWERQGDRFTLEVTIPPNSQATIRIPTSNAATVTESGTHLTKSSGIEVLPAQSQYVLLRTEAGTYRFSSILRP